MCGERGIRTPGAVTLNGFQDHRIRPLCHFSTAKVDIFLIIENFFAINWLNKLIYNYNLFQIAIYP